MTIAEDIYTKVQTLPDELSREVLDFVYFIESRYAFKLVGEHDSQSAKKKIRTPGSAIGKLKILVEDDEHLQDFQDYMP